VWQIAHAFSSDVFLEGTSTQLNPANDRLDASTDSNSPRTYPTSINPGAVHTLVAYGGAGSGQPLTLCGPGNTVGPCSGAPQIYAGATLTYRVQFTSPWQSMASGLTLDLTPPSPWAPVTAALALDFAAPPS
jgi:hypothetical protein